MNRSLAIVAGLAVVASAAASAVADRAGAAMVGCDQAATRIVATSDVELDASCTYTAGVDITASGVTLDCRGARIASTSGAGRGITIVTPVDVALADVTVRNCHVEGFLNSLRVTRDGFRTLPDGAEFEHPTSNITIEDSTFSGSRGVGVFVDGYVSGVTIRRSTIRDAGSSGIYLETGSKQNRVVDNDIVDNGLRENGPGGQEVSVGGTTLWFWGVGREGVSVDGSSDNEIVGNRFSGNSAGGVFLYKNCGEYPDRPAYFERRDPADRNLIEANTFDGGRVGVWVASRMGENTLPMDCSDPAYLDLPGRRIVRDRARSNTVRANAFHDVTYGIRVEDDDTVVEANTFTAPTPDHHAVTIGTPYRTEVLDEPVAGTVLRDNESTIVGNDSPYRWVHGHRSTTVTGNRALGREVGLCEGEPIPRQPFIFAIAIAAPLPDGSKPPTPDLTVPTVGALPSCWRAAAPATPTAPAARPTDAAPAQAQPGRPSYAG